MLVTLEQSSARDVGLGASGSSSFGLLLLNMLVNLVPLFGTALLRLSQDLI